MEELTQIPLCPFCGVGEMRHKKDCFIQMLSVHLDHVHFDDEEMLNAWNTRASVSHADLQKVIDKCQRLINEYQDSPSNKHDSVYYINKGRIDVLEFAANELKALLEPQTKDNQ